MKFSHRSDTRKPVTVQLVGGLGNQVFGYFAGEYLRAAFDHNVEYIPSVQANGVFGLTSSITDLGIQPYDLSKHTKNRYATLKRRLYTAGIRVGLDENLLRSKMRLFRSQEVGFDSRLDYVTPGTLVEGYFQSYMYIDYVSGKIGPPVISIQNPTPWLSDQIHKISEESPIMVHVRRGDYRNLASTNGNLDSTYYLEGVDAIMAELGKRPIWVFSDEPAHVQSELGSKLPKSALYVFQPRNSTAAEALYLMSLGSGSVISNSTFSWWSAKLRSGGPTVAPESWFKALPEPLHLIPPDWVRIPSTWV